MFKQLLVPLDGSTLAEQALVMAGSLARASSAALDVAMAHEPLAFGVERGGTAALDLDHKYLESIVDELWTGAHIQATHSVLRGNAAEMICARALDVDADLIVMSSHGRTGLSRAWLGSVADGVVRQSARPVLVIRPMETASRPEKPAWLPINRVLVPLDGSQHASSILPVAVELARCNGAQVVLLQVVRPATMMAMDLGSPFVSSLPATDDAATAVLKAEAHRYLTGVKRGLSDDGFANVATRVIVSPFVAEAIREAARGYAADVIAMSTHGRGASRLVVGSVVDKVRRACDLPVLLRRPNSVTEELGFLSTRNDEQQLPSLAGA